MKNLLGAVLMASALSVFSVAAAAALPNRPTIILVHGAFAESASWNGVIEQLKNNGFKAVAAANPLRGVAFDAASVSAIIRSLSGPVVLVGHSYGGAVITEAANSNSNVKALVYVAAFAPEKGESSLALSGKFPGSTLGSALITVPSQDGGQDLYIDPEKFHAQFAADLKAQDAALMAATQRPVSQAALAETSGEASWRRIPSYAIYGSDDRNIPGDVLKFMAERAKSEKTVVLPGASHALMISHAKEVAALIMDAASQ